MTGEAGIGVLCSSCWLGGVDIFTVLLIRIHQDTFCTHDSPALWLQVANLVTITDCLIRDFFFKFVVEEIDKAGYYW